MIGDYFSVGYDSEFQSDRRVSTDTMTPESRMAIPCDTCPRMDECAARLTECSAFRTWSAKGHYETSDLGRHLRSINTT